MVVTSVVETVLSFAADNVTLSLVLILTLLYLGSEIFSGFGQHLPPSPWQFPIIGSVPMMLLKPEAFLQNMTTKYGGVYRLRFGNTEAVILGSYKAMKEAFVDNGENFSGRPQTFNLVSYIWSGRGIGVEDGPAWKEQRRFALTTLRDFGFGKLSMEDTIRVEADRITEVLKNSNGSLIELQPFFHNASANVICSVTFGRSFGYDDPEFTAIRKTIVDGEKNIVAPLVALLPWTRFVSKTLSGMSSLKRFKTELNNFTQKYIDQHKATFDEKAKRDYLDCYLAEMNSRQEKNPKDVGSFDEIRLRSNLYLMFFAGVSSTSGTLNWAFRMLVAFPEMQAQLHEEIDRVVGSDRQVTYADRTQMPLCESFLNEVQRYGDVNPIGLPHTNLEATKLFGYDIPKRTIIIPYMRGVNQDPALWGDPENFRPSRFINENGSLFKPEYFIPFGSGKRACMGEALARTELFLMMTSLLQRFSFALPGDVKLGAIQVTSLARIPPQYKICATSRAT